MISENIEVENKITWYSSFGKPQCVRLFHVVEYFGNSYESWVITYYDVKICTCVSLMFSFWINESKCHLLCYLIKFMVQNYVFLHLHTHSFGCDMKALYSVHHISIET